MGYKYHKQYRLPGFEYAGEGEYFVTICIADRRKYFGEIEKGEMILSELGELVIKIWTAIPAKFENVKLDAYQVMPDHFHGIIILKEGGHLINLPAGQAGQMRASGQKPVFNSGINNNPMESMGTSLGKIIRWFKGRVKYEARKINPDFKWQSKFYDRIIRDDREFYFISEYIANNPVNWGKGMLETYLKSRGNS
jgi:putative transposase